MDVVFLDANVLFSAAYRADAGLRRLWGLPDVELITSQYAYVEARLNLAREDREPEEKVARLEELMQTVRVVPQPPSTRVPEGIQLPEKDRPIILAALRAGATHLLTGDVKHFGPSFNTRGEGVLVLPPAAYLHPRVG